MTMRAYLRRDELTEHRNQLIDCYGENLCKGDFYEYICSCDKIYIETRDDGRKEFYCMSRTNIKQYIHWIIDEIKPNEDFSTDYGVKLHTLLMEACIDTKPSDDNIDTYSLVFKIV